MGDITHETIKGTLACPSIKSCPSIAAPPANTIADGLMSEQIPDMPMSFALGMPQVPNCFRYTNGMPNPVVGVVLRAVALMLRRRRGRVSAR